MRFTRSFPLLQSLVGIFATLAVACSPTYPKCDSDDHCAEKGEVCVEGTCQQCRDVAQCGDGEVCNGGRCEPKVECAADADCEGNKVCRSGKCKIECAADGDCGAGMSCLEGRCREASCTTIADCAPGMMCLDGRCAPASLDAAMSACPTGHVRFEFNRSRLTRDSRGTLEAYAPCITAFGGVVTVEGHCDERGTEEYNLSLGEQRARSVRKYLMGLGVPADRLRVLSKGETSPIDFGHSESSWSQNRRAEFVE